MTVCHLCNHDAAPIVYHVHGLISSYVECDFCFHGLARPDEPELILDTFQDTRPAETLDLLHIVDKLCGTRT